MPQSVTSTYGDSKAHPIEPFGYANLYFWRIDNRYQGVYIHTILV